MWKIAASVLLKLFINSKERVIGKTGKVILQLAVIRLDPRDLPPESGRRSGCSGCVQGY